MECLWPEEDPSALKGRLWVAIHSLRRALELPGQEDLVLTQGDTYTLNIRAPYRLDVEDFLQGMARGEAQEVQGHLAGALEGYLEAAQLYQGDFLEEQPYSEWCLAEREYLREVYLSLLKRIARLYQEKGDYESAILYYRRALAQDKLREEVHRHLMLCLARAGRRDEALHQYQECAQVLASELGVSPLEETQKLYQQLRDSPEPPSAPPAPLA